MGEMETMHAAVRLLLNAKAGEEAGQGPISTECDLSSTNAGSYCSELGTRYKTEKD